MRGNCLIRLPEGCCWPDYRNCGINMMSSVLLDFGLPTVHPGLPVLDDLLKKPYRNIVLLLLDGLSNSALEEHLPDTSFLRLHNRHTLSAVFPSTTTAATTSIRTALSPAEHGWLGWTMYFPQLDESVDIFPNTKQFQRVLARDFHCAQEYFPLKTATQRINEAKAGRAFSVSPYDEVRADSLPTISHAVQEICNMEGRHFIYAYWGEPDASMHSTGCMSTQTHLVINSLDLQVQRMAETMPEDTLLLVTADHGLVDAKPECFEHHPRLMDMLVRAPVVEPRAAALFVKPDQKMHFQSAFQQAFGEDFILIKSEEAVASGLFGPGIPHERIMDTLGDYLALSVSNKALYMKKEQCNLIGMHAGLLKREMQVPLIIARE